MPLLACFEGISWHPQDMDIPISTSISKDLVGQWRPRSWRPWCASTMKSPRAPALRAPEGLTVSVPRLWCQHESPGSGAWVQPQQGVKQTAPSQRTHPLGEGDQRRTPLWGQASPERETQSSTSGFPGGFQTEGLSSKRKTESGRVTLRVAHLGWNCRGILSLALFLIMYFHFGFLLLVVSFVGYRGLGWL